MQIIISGRYNIRMATDKYFGKYYNYDCHPCKFDGIPATFNSSKSLHCDVVQILIRPNDMPNTHKLRAWMPRYPIQRLVIYCHLSNENIEI